MPARTPEEIHALFGEYFSGGDIDSVMSLYEPHATIVPQPGQPVSGAAAVRAALEGFMSLKGDFRMEHCRVIKANDIALLFSRWTLTAKNPDGSPLTLSGQTSDVVREQADGTWLFLIDSPFGADGMPG